MKSSFTSLILFMGACFTFNPMIYAQLTEEQEQMKTTSLAYDPYKSYPVYSGNDLGVNYSDQVTILKVWSPPAEEMRLRLYKTSQGVDLVEEVSCQRDNDGVWTAHLPGDRRNLYYTFQAKIDGKWNEEHSDLYAIAVGTNGKRG